MDIKLPDISDALKPLPRLKSLVITELENIGRKAPIDRKVFLYAFLGVFAVLMAVAFTLPMFMKSKPVEVAAQTATPPAPPALTPAQQDASLMNDAHWTDPLPPAPVPELMDMATNIPIISTDGRQSWVVYGRPYNRKDGRPRIAVVISDLGLTQQISQSAISDLPGPISLVFSHLSAEADAWMARARQLGHEVLLAVPMEPLDYPASDPGPDTLLVHNSIDDNKKLLLKYLETGKGYVGLTSLSGSRMSTSPEKLKPILQELKSRGLMWLDANLTPLSSGDLISKEVQLPSVKADLHIDENMGTEAIQKVLQDAEATANKDGHAVIIVQATPLAVSILREWAGHMPDKHISLAPVTAIID